MNIRYIIYKLQLRLRLFVLYNDAAWGLAFYSH